jgi:hypothetical protein
MGDHEYDEETAMMWQDALDEVAAGRPRDLHCPFCIQGEVAVTTDDQTKRTRLTCRACKRFIEVKLANDPTLLSTSTTKKTNG